MKLNDIKPDDILVFDEEVKVDDVYSINGMFGHNATVVDEMWEEVELVNIEELDEDLKIKVLDIINNDRFELSRNE